LQNEDAFSLLGILLLLFFSIFVGIKGWVEAPGPVGIHPHNHPNPLPDAAATPHSN